MTVTERVSTETGQDVASQVALDEQRAWHSIPAASAILLVEDERPISDAITAGLSEHRVTAVFNGEEALEVIGQRPFDVVVLDLRLPGIDGLEVLEKLKADPVVAHIPVVVLTAHGEAHEKVRAFELGAHDFITKPFILAELRARICAATRAKRMHDSLLARIQEYEKARDEAERCARAKCDFVASMSHEIRTPMNGVIAMTGLLQQTVLNAEQRDFVETIRASGESLLTIINDILKVSKLEAGKLELEERSFSLHDCVEGALDVLAPRAAEQNIDLAFELEPGLPEAVFGDDQRLRQVLLNLLGNAVKFTHQGQVVLTVRPADDGALAFPRLNAAGVVEPTRRIEFIVRDSGIGITPDKLGELFQPFVQAAPSTERTHGGTGLGLAISKGLVELMGGQIWAESTPGAGSTFRFTLPLKLAREQAAGPEVSPLVLEGRYLLGTLNDEVSAITGRMLARWGAECLRARDTMSLVEGLRSSHHKAAILDVRLLANPAVSTALAASRVPLVLVSPLGAMPEELAPLPVAKRVISAPVKPQQLWRALQEILSGATAAHSPRPVAAPAPAAATGRNLAQTLPMRILVTDDNVINQKVAVRMLQQFGYAADLAASGSEALAAMARQSYDLIFMDVQMPGMDGLEATRQIRNAEARAATKAVKIVAMTANAMAGDREKCLAAGMNDYLAKPVRPEALQAALERAAAPTATPSAVMPPVVSPPPVPPVPAAPPEIEEVEGLVDFEHLLDFAGGSRTSLIEITDLYFNQTSEQLSRLRSAWQAGDAQTVVRVAHSSAGASGVCGIRAMEAPFRLAEKLGKESRLGELEPLLLKLEATFKRVQALILNSRDNLPLN